MEQKKTLWIIAAVGIFLLVVLGGGVIIYRTSIQGTPAIASAKTAEKAKPAELVNQAAEENRNTEIRRPGFEEIQTNKVNEMVVVSENTTVYDLNKASAEPEPPQPQAVTPAAASTTIDLNALKKEITAEVAAAASQGQQPQNINITVTMPEKAAPVIVTPDYNAEKSSKTSVEKPIDKKEEVKKTAAPAPKAEPAKTVIAKKETKPAPKVQENKKTETKAEVKTAAKAITRYWVQVAAYTNKKTAENAREALTSNKITSDIFTYQDTKNRLFYRVRVGPYTTKSEAEYWQAKIAKIDDFKDSKSYVASTTD